MNAHFMNRYKKFIEFYQNNLPEGFVERHHIIPKCMGGSNDKSNLVLLPVRAHFIAHYLLHKAYPENASLAHSFAMMGVNNNHQKRSSKLYEKSKVARSTALKGKPRPEWVKEKLRKPKTSTENYKKAKTKEHKEAISKALKGKAKTKEHIEATSKALKERFQKHHELKSKEKEFYINEFLRLQITRKEFCCLYPELPESRIRIYLKGI